MRLTSIHHTSFLVLLLWLSSCGYSKHTATNRSSSVENVPPARRLSEEELKRKYADMLQVSPKEIRDEKLYYFIDEWWGTRYKYGGNDRNGIDCSGFTLQLYKQVYSMQIKRNSGMQYDAAKLIHKVKKLEEGDLVFFSSTGSKSISHVGVYLHNDYFVHASTGKGVMISNLHDDYWDKHYVAGGRVQ